MASRILSKSRKKTTASSSISPTRLADHDVPPLNAATATIGSRTPTDRLLNARILGANELTLYQSDAATGSSARNPPVTGIWSKMPYHLPPRGDDEFEATQSTLAVSDSRTVLGIPHITGVKLPFYPCHILLIFFSLLGYILLQFRYKKNILYRNGYGPHKPSWVFNAFPHILMFITNFIVGLVC